MSLRHCFPTVEIRINGCIYTPRPRNGSSALDGGKLYLTGSIQSRDQVCFCLGLNPAVSSFMQAEVLFVKQNFAVIILGGTGQVGGAAVAELLSIPECREVVMVTRKPIAPRSRIRNVVLDTGAADFAERTAALAREVLSQGPVSAVSCVGVGSGSMRWSEEELKRLEVGVVGAFARGCHDAGITQFCLLSAAGSTARSRFRYVRVMGMKEDTVRSIGFTPFRHLSPWHHRRQRSYPRLGRLVRKTRPGIVWQY